MMCCAVKTPAAMMMCCAVKTPAINVLFFSFFSSICFTLFSMKLLNFNFKQSFFLVLTSMCILLWMFHMSHDIGHGPLDIWRPKLTTCHMTLDMAHWTYGAQIDHMSHDNRKGGFVHVKANSGHDSCHVTSGIAASSCCPKLRPTPPCHHFHQLSMLGVANGSSGHQPFRVATFLLSKPTSHHSF